MHAGSSTIPRLRSARSPAPPPTPSPHRRPRLPHVEPGDRAHDDHARHLHGQRAAQADGPQPADLLRHLRLLRGRAGGGPDRPGEADGVPQGGAEPRRPRHQADRQGPCPGWRRQQRQADPHHQPDGARPLPQDDLAAADRAAPGDVRARADGRAEPAAAGGQGALRPALRQAEGQRRGPPRAENARV